MFATVQMGLGLRRGTHKDAHCGVSTAAPPNCINVVQHPSCAHVANHTGGDMVWLGLQRCMMSCVSVVADRIIVDPWRSALALVYERYEVELPPPTSKTPVLQRACHDTLDCYFIHMRVNTLLFNSHGVAGIASTVCDLRAAVGGGDSCVDHIVIT